jgi:hypothetical protein
MLGLCRFLEKLRQRNLSLLPRLLREGHVFFEDERLVLHRGFQILLGLRLNPLCRKSRIEGQQRRADCCDKEAQSEIDPASKTSASSRC